MADHGFRIVPQTMNWSCSAGWVGVVGVVEQAAFLWKTIRFLEGYSYLGKS